MAPQSASPRSTTVPSGLTPKSMLSKDPPTAAAQGRTRARHKVAAPITRIAASWVSFIPGLLSGLVRDSRRQSELAAVKARALVGPCRWISASRFCVDHPRGFQDRAVTGDVVIIGPTSQPIPPSCFSYCQNQRCCLWRSTADVLTAHST